MTLDRKVFLCDCSDTRHQLVYDQTYLEEEGVVTISMQMNPHSGLWDRLVTAFKYIFQLETGIGHYGEVIIDCNSKEFLSEKEYWDRFDTYIKQSRSTQELKQ